MFKVISTSQPHSDNSGPYSGKTGLGSWISFRGESLTFSQSKGWKSKARSSKPNANLTLHDVHVHVCHPPPCPPALFSECKKPDQGTVPLAPILSDMLNIYSLAHEQPHVSSLSLQARPTFIINRLLLDLAGSDARPACGASDAKLCWGLKGIALDGCDDWSSGQNYIDESVKVCN